MANQKKFQTPFWVANTNIYEVNIRQYSTDGTFKGFEPHLTRLKLMGVETLWFMPIYPIGKKNRKGTLGSYYSISDYEAVNPEFGTMEDFRELVEKAHELGFKVILDWVANHTAWDHSWTKTHPEYYEKDKDGNFVPPFPEWEDVIHLNHDSRLYESAMIDAMNFWVREFNIAGFRCDMAHLVPLTFWKNARKILDEKKSLFWLAETENPEYLYVFDCIYTWEFMHAMQSFSKGIADLKTIKEVVDNYHKHYPEDGTGLYFTSNHDENSWNGTEYERLGDFAVPFAVMCHTLKGIPLIYNGQEEPLKTHRLNFFDKDHIDWKEYAMEEFYHRSLHLKQQNPALGAGIDADFIWVENNHPEEVISFLRIKENNRVLVVINFSKTDLSDLKLTSVDGSFSDAFSKEKIGINGHSSFHIWGLGYRIFTSNEA